MNSESPNSLRRQSYKRDYYREFIEGSRWLRREHSAARIAWFEQLEVNDKKRQLFEFEMLLKGLVCFGNPVNHPGPPLRGEPAVARAFKGELGVARTIIQNIVETGKRLTQGKGNVLIFQRYLESVVAQDDARFKIVKNSLAQDTPQQSLALLVSALENLLEIVDGLARMPHISYRLFASVIRMAQREIHRSTYFDPLAVLEFRAEFDKIGSQKTLKVIAKIVSEPGKKVVALTFLSLFRLLKYLSALENVAKGKQNPAMMLGWLAVLRSDMRALTVFLKRETSTWISKGFGSLYEELEPAELKLGFERFEEEFHLLRSLKELLTSIGDQLRLEQRKVYEQQLPSVGALSDSEEFAQRAIVSAESLRSFIQNAAVLIGKEFEPSIDGREMFPDFVSISTHSARLRRDIWMFQQILRAFIEKAKGSAKAADQWTGMNTFNFVRQFIIYFRSMGYHLLRYSDYEEFDRFMSLVDRLREGDVLEVQRVSNVISACETFQKYLKSTFEAVSQREELADIPFDRKEAARTLKLFLNR